MTIQFPPYQAAPVGPANGAGPEGVRTVGQAVALGLLSLNAQVSGFGVGAQNPTIEQLLANGSITSNTLVSSLTFVTVQGNATFGGN